MVSENFSRVRGGRRSRGFGLRQALLNLLAHLSGPVTLRAFGIKAQVVIQVCYKRYPVRPAHVNSGEKEVGLGQVWIRAESFPKELLRFVGAAQADECSGQFIVGEPASWGCRQQLAGE